ncbi:MAG: GAF domain-containing protein [Desulfobulbaceae bacterium]|nr:GAF domain-containing protein [Desulfobulbaceae bacterium]
MEEAEKRAFSTALILKNRVSVLTSENTRVAKVLAGFIDVQLLLLDPDEKRVINANRLLDYFRESLELSVCYIMDAKGSTVASSNRNEPGSFVGQNYKFRPYFIKSIQGEPGVNMYLALGVTSNIRGVYHSYPIYSNDSQKPIGCAVIKAHLSQLEQELSEIVTGTWGLTGPYGVILASSKKDWVYKTLWKAGPQEITRISNSCQFGKGPWGWIGLKEDKQGYATDSSGRNYMIQKMDINHYTEWINFYLTDVNSVLSILSDPLMKNRGVIVLLLFLLICSLVLSLYFYGRSELIRKKKMEQTLQIQNEYLSALHQTSLGLINRLEFNELIETILSRAGALTGTSSGVLSLYNETREELVIRVGLGLFKKALGYTVKPGEGFSGKIWQKGTSLIVDDYAQWEGRLPNSKIENLHSFIGIPMKSGENVSGVLGLAHSETEKKFGENELDILSRFAELASIAIDNARLYSQLQTANHELQQLVFTVKALVVCWSGREDLNFRVGGVCL